MGKGTFLIALFGIVVCFGIWNARVLSEHKELPSFAASKWDINSFHLDAAKRVGCSFISSSSDLKKNLATGDLVKVESSKGFFIPNLNHSCAAMTPNAKQIVQQMGLEFYRQTGCSFIVTSMTRTAQQQKKLSKGNINAASESAHCYGTTFDVSYINFEKCTNKSVQDLSSILENTVQFFRREGLILAIKEKRQKCFHITVLFNP
jgi:hypothetical protein